MPNMKDFTPEKHLKYLFLGRSGAGKSQAFATWRGAETKKYLFSLDRRLSTLAGTNTDYDIFAPAQGFAAMEKKILALRKENPYEAISLAGITALEDMLLEEAKIFLGASRAGGRKVGTLQMTDVQHYGYVNTAMEQVIQNGMFSLDCDVIIEGHIVNAYDAEGKVNGDRLLTTDKRSEKIPGYFDEIWLFTKTPDMNISRPPIYKVHFRNSVARTSFKNFPNSLDITGKDLWEMVGPLMDNKDEKPKLTA